MQLANKKKSVFNYLQAGVSVKKSFSQFLPSTIRVTNIPDAKFPEEFINVAGMSIIVLIMTITGTASNGKPKIFTINISAIMPPPGIAPITAPTKKAPRITVTIAEGVVISLPKIPNKKAIFITPPITDPSL